MADVYKLINYFQKLKTIIIDEADMTIFDTKIVNKKRVDDVMCCIIATFPSSYKRNINMKSLKTAEFKSITCFKQLYKLVNRPFFLIPGHYLIPYGAINALIKTIVSNLAYDIEKIEYAANPNADN